MKPTFNNHAIRPSLRLDRGGDNWEILPAADLTEIVEESKQRKSSQ